MASEKVMQILHVTKTMDPKAGGVCQAVRGLVPELEAAGCHNEVACLDDPQAAFINMDAFPLHTCGPGKGPWWINAKLSLWLKDNIGRFDVVILHGLWAYTSHAVQHTLEELSKQQSGRSLLSSTSSLPKLYVMPHGMLDPWFQKLSIRPLKAIRNWFFWKVSEHRIVNNADGLLFACEEECRLARIPFSPYKPAAEHVVGLGVQPPPPLTEAMQAAFVAKCPGLEGSKYLLFLSRLHPKKGPDTLIQAYAKAIAPLPAGAAAPKLVIAGPGLDTPYGRHLQNLAATHCPPHSVFWPGMLLGDAKWGAFLGSEAFILPSHQENFGIAVVEALACGKPVLISDQVNIWREIAHDDACLVESDTLEATTTLLQRWFAMPQDKREILAQNAVSCFQTNFLPGAATKKLLAAIRQQSPKSYDAPHSLQLAPGSLSHS